MRIRRHEYGGQIIGYAMWLNAWETYLWATRPHAAWPCSQARSNRLMIQVDSNGLCDFTVNGKDADMDGNELDAIVSDHLPDDCKHLWPVWKQQEVAGAA
jgi:hypothetical protein